MEGIDIDRVIVYNLNLIAQIAIMVNFTQQQLHHKYPKIWLYLIGWLCLVPLQCIEMTMKQHCLVAKVVMFCIFVLFCWYFYEDTVHKKLKTLVWSMIIIMATHFVVAVIYHTNISEELKDLQDALYAQIINTTWVTFLLFSVTTLIMIHFTFKEKQFRIQLLFAVLGIVLSQSVMLYLVCTEFFRSTSISLLALFITLCSGYFSYALVQNTKQLECSIALLACSSMQQEMNKEYYDLALKKEQQFAFFRHDFANQIQAVKALYTVRKYKESDQLLSQMEHNLAEMKQAVYCTHPIINMVVALKVEEAQRKGINISVRLADVSETGIEDIDLCSVFSNILDNAIEATDKCEEKVIVLKTGLRYGYMSITCENTYNASYDEGEKAEHGVALRGYGLQIIQKIVEKYHGQVSVYPKEERFIIAAQLKSSSYGYDEKETENM